MITRHPTKRDIFALAEAMAGGRPIDARLAGHVKRCTRCKRELDSVRDSLAVTASSRALDPSDALTAKILARAKAERGPTRIPASTRHNGFVQAIKLTALAASLVVAAGISFQMATGPSARFSGSSVSTSASDRHRVSDVLEPERTNTTQPRGNGAVREVGPDVTPASLGQWEKLRGVENGATGMNSSQTATKAPL